MATVKSKLGIIASEACGTPVTSPKRWFHLDKFIKEYYEVLSRYELFTTQSSAGIIDQSLATLTGNSNGKTPLCVTPLGDSFRGVVKLAAMVARKQIERVLIFQDPNDLSIERPERYALLRNCNLAGARLYINSAAHLWALHECKTLKIHKSRPYDFMPIKAGDLEETVALIAHDNEKPRMARFALHYRNVLRKFPRLIATSGTKKSIDEFLKNAIPPRERLIIKSAGATDQDSHGPSGGDVIIADEIFDSYGTGGVASKMPYYSLHNVLFFIDHKHSHPHEPDIQVLLRTCANPEHRVNLILNSRTAEEWAERYV